MTLRVRKQLVAGVGLGLLIAFFSFAPSFGQAPAGGGGAPLAGPDNHPPQDGQSAPGGQRGPAGRGFRGQGRGPRGGPEGAPGGAGREESVEGAMRGMGRAARQLRDSVADAGRKEDNLRLVGEMERSCVTAKLQPVPEDLLKAAGDDAAQAKLKETYHADLLALLHKLVDLDQSITDGRTDDAKKLLGEVMQMQQKGHKDLGVKMGPGRR